MDDVIAAFERDLALARAAADPGIDHLEPDTGAFATPRQYGRAGRIAEAVLDGHDCRRCQMVFLPSFRPQRAVYVVSGDTSGRHCLVAREFRGGVWRAIEALVRVKQQSAPSAAAHNAAREAPHKAASEAADESAREAAHASGSERASDAATAARREAPASGPGSVKSELLEWQMELGEAAVERLDRVWTSMLLRVRHPDRARQGADGTRYHAAHFTPGIGYRTGTTWSPDSRTPVGEFVAMAEALFALPRLTASDQQSATQVLLERCDALLGRL